MRASCLLSTTVQNLFIHRVKKKTIQKLLIDILPQMRAVCMAELGQMPTHGMNGFILLVNLLISSTSKLYKYMQHTSWPTVCGTNTFILVSFFSSVLFYKMCMQLGTVPESCCCPCWEEKVARFGRSPSQAIS